MEFCLLKLYIYKSNQIEWWNRIFLANIHLFSIQCIQSFEFFVCVESKICMYYVVTTNSQIVCLASLIVFYTIHTSHMQFCIWNFRISETFFFVCTLYSCSIECIVGIFKLVYQHRLHAYKFICILCSATLYILIRDFGVSTETSLLHL